ncbi:hypothetical protein BGZ94_007551 [Podila epigama]|nr:hypothetical protein BGZ94_007551 [Podila epigama]
MSSSPTLPTLFSSFAIQGSPTLPPIYDQNMPTFEGQCNTPVTMSSFLSEMTTSTTEFANHVQAMDNRLSNIPGPAQLLWQQAPHLLDVARTPLSSIPSSSTDIDMALQSHHQSSSKTTTTTTAANSSNKGLSDLQFESLPISEETVISSASIESLPPSQLISGHTRQLPQVTQTTMSALVEQMYGRTSNLNNSIGHAHSITPAIAPAIAPMEGENLFGSFQTNGPPYLSAANVDNVSVAMLPTEPLYLMPEPMLFQPSPWTQIHSLDFPWMLQNSPTLTPTPLPTPSSENNAQGFFHFANTFGAPLSSFPNGLATVPMPALQGLTAIPSGAPFMDLMAQSNSFCSPLPGIDQLQLTRLAMQQRSSASLAQNLPHDFCLTSPPWKPTTARTKEPVSPVALQEALALLQRLKSFEQDQEVGISQGMQSSSSSSSLSLPPHLGSVPMATGNSDLTSSASSSFYSMTTKPWDFSETPLSSGLMLEAALPMQYPFCFPDGTVSMFAIHPSAEEMPPTATTTTTTTESSSESLAMLTVPFQEEVKQERPRDSDLKGLSDNSFAFEGPRQKRLARGYDATVASADAGTEADGESDTEGEIDEEEDDDENEIDNDNDNDYDNDDEDYETAVDDTMEEDDEEVKEDEEDVDEEDEEDATERMKQYQFQTPVRRKRARSEQDLVCEGQPPQQRQRCQQQHDTSSSFTDSNNKHRSIGDGSHVDMQVEKNEEENDTNQLVPDGMLQCEFRGCPRTFSTQGLLRSHMVVHVDGKPYVCDLCKGAKRYKRNHDLLRHQREIHMEEDPIAMSVVGLEALVGHKNNPLSISLARDRASEVQWPGPTTMTTATTSMATTDSSNAADSTLATTIVRRPRRQRRVQVEHRTVWNGSEMQEIEVKVIRPRGRPRVRPLKGTPSVSASSSSFSIPSTSTSTSTYLSSPTMLETPSSCSREVSSSPAPSSSPILAPSFLPMIDTTMTTINTAAGPSCIPRSPVATPMSPTMTAFDTASTNKDIEASMETVQERNMRDAFAKDPNSPSANQLQEWLRAEAEAVTGWQSLSPQDVTMVPGQRPYSYHQDKETSDLIRSCQWGAMNARAFSDLQRQTSFGQPSPSSCSSWSSMTTALRHLKEWLAISIMENYNNEKDPMFDRLDHSLKVALGIH